MNRWLLNHLPSWAIMLVFVVGAMRVGALIEDARTLRGANRSP